MGSHGLGDILSRPEADRIFDVLRDRHRRLILLELHAGRVRTVGDVSMRGADSDEQAIRLEHEHLPKLEEAGYVEWDRETGRLEKGPNFEEVEPLVDLLERHADELPPEWP